MTMTKTAVLYARVSREEQVKGFSLRQQIEALRDHAAKHDYEVRGEIEDAGYPGDTLVRPGLDRVRDLVDTGEVSVVLAQDADRISREPMHRMILDEEATRHGCRWAALDDWGDGSHEGQLLKFMKGWVSKGERLKTAERTRRGSLRKVREGKLIKSRSPNYGFRFVGEKGDAYEVDEPKMAVVRRVFGMVADGASLHEVCRTLDVENVPSPTGGSWSRTQVRRIVLAEVYHPHAISDLRTMGVREDVLGRLDADALYGVWYYNRRDVATERVRENGEYRKTSRWTYRDPSEWIAVPVPDAGIGRETVGKAVSAISNNVALSRAGDRFWELSGGVTRCAECGSTFKTRRRKHDDGSGYYHYYVCRVANSGGGCGHKKNYRAEALERAVVGLVDSELFYDRATLERWIDAAMGENRPVRDPGVAERTCAKELAAVAKERDRLVRLYTTGRVGEADYDRLAAELDGREASARAELERARMDAERASASEANRREILEAYGTGLQLGLLWFPPHLRRQVYDALGLAVLVSPGAPEPGLEIEGSFSANIIRLTREVAQYAAALKDAEKRLHKEEREAPARGYATTVLEPDGTTATVRVPPGSQRVERLERKLTRVRDEQTPRPSRGAGRG